MRDNTLRQLLDAGKPSLGTHVLTTDPRVYELVGNSGNYDYAEFVAEYAPFDLYSLENIARTVELFPHMTCMMKVSQSNRTFQAARAIGAGIQNLLFADPRTVTDVEECIASVRAEMPGQSRGIGIHGVGMQRDAGITLEGGTPGWVRALSDSVVAIMIEKKQAVDDLESLLSVPGIDMIQFGPTDYSVSIGVPGQDGRPGTTKHPKVVEAERKVIYTAQRMNIAVRAEPPSPALMQSYLDMGVKHFCSGGDMVSLWQHFKGTGAEFNTKMGREAPCALPYGRHRGGDKPGASAMGYGSNEGGQDGNDAKKAKKV